MARVWMCVRCGSAPRAEDLYVCQVCYDDPQQRKEASEAVDKVGEAGRLARNYLVKTFHWAGRWSTRG